MDYRQQFMTFPKAKLIQDGYERIDVYVDRMRENILNKDGIVPAPEKTKFNFFVEKCMNKAMIQ
jgi:hypothetical protein